MLICLSSSTNSLIIVYCTYSAFGETGDDTTLDPTYPDTVLGGYTGQLQCGVYKPTNVISVSYGGQEDDLPAYYQKRQCNEFLKLGLQGVSIFYASGDDGVAGPQEAIVKMDAWALTAPSSVLPGLTLALISPTLA